MAFLTFGVWSSAASAFFFKGTGLPLRKPSFCVISSSHSMSLSRPARESALKPPKTTVWGAPSRVQASIATGNSGTMPM